MDESTYYNHAKNAFSHIEDAFDDDAVGDGDAIDCERAGDVLTLTFRDGKKCVVNTQRPTRQIWLAADARAWHFSYDEATGRWLDDKGQGVELFARVRDIVREHTGIALSL